MHTLHLKKILVRNIAFNALLFKINIKVIKIITNALRFLYYMLISGRPYTLNRFFMDFLTPLTIVDSW